MARPKREETAIGEETTVFDGTPEEQNEQESREGNSGNERKSNKPLKVKSVHRGVSVSIGNTVVALDENGEAEVSPEIAQKMRNIPGYEV